jgi:transcriptional regulator with XRE-family HTH domain
MADEVDDALFRLLGERIRAARERRTEKLSQVALATKLGVSRASIVNIESGRQHASLPLLWRLTQALEIELADLIPRSSELLEKRMPQAELNESMLQQIKTMAAGDGAAEKNWTDLIGQLIAQAKSSNPRKKS